MAIWLVPGDIKCGEKFTLSYVTDNGGALKFCDLSNKSGYTSLRSPSGTGKSTLLGRFVKSLQNKAPHSNGELHFVQSLNNQNVKVAAIPQHPPFVNHWRVRSFFSTESALAKSAFGEGEWAITKEKLLGELSGGQQRRIYMCSVLESLAKHSTESTILLLDETLDGLNPLGAGDFLNKCADWWANTNSGSIYFFIVTHLPNIITKVPETIKMRLSIQSEEADRIYVRVFPYE